MKYIIILSLFTLNSSLLTLHAGVPKRWDVDLAARQPQVFTIQRPRGETYEIEAVLNEHGKPFEPSITNACIYWQTNGMENLYWSAPASVSNNVLRATWLPSMDPGAATVRGYIGDPGHIYAAAFQFRFIASPGATPNELPLPQKVIDFAKVKVLNPPWSGGGGGGGVDTNAVIDIVHKTVDGSARTLPPYLHYLEMDDTYPDAAAEYYYTWGGGVSPAQCSSVRDGGFLSRNYDWNFDFMPEFVVRCVATASSPSCPSGRLASIAVCNVGTNLTEADVTSGKWSKWYKALPCHAVDGINENGVAVNVNVVDGDPLESGWTTNGTIHCLGAVRWVLDHATNAASAARVVATEVYFPSVWQQNLHWMIADESSTYIVENGSAHAVTNGVPVLTNFRLYGDPKDTTGEGQERYVALTNGANITSQWWTLTYAPDGYRASDLPGVTGQSLTNLFDYWASKPREAHRGESFAGTNWWQTVHTSVYDLTNRTLRICVQETPDWYVFHVPTAGGVKPDAVREIVEPMIGEAIAANEKEGTDQQIVRGATNEDGIVQIDVRGAIQSGTAAIANSATSDAYGRQIDLTYATKAELDAKRDSNDNTCHKTEFTEWVCTPPLPEGWSIKWYDSPEYPESHGWRPYNPGTGFYPGTNKGDPSSTELTWDNDWQEMYRFTATRSAVCTSNELYTTKGYVDGSISTNNPAFVEAVTGITPPSSPTLRVYDEVRQCWWIGKMVNGVINWEVE